MSTSQRCIGTPGRTSHTRQQLQLHQYGTSQQKSAKNKKPATVADALGKDVIDRLAFSVKPHIDFKGMENDLERHMRNVKERRMEHMIDVEHVASMYREACLIEQQIVDLRFLRRHIAAILMPKGNKAAKAKQENDNERMDEVAMCDTLQRYLPVPHSQDGTQQVEQRRSTRIGVAQELIDAAMQIISSSRNDHNSVVVYPNPSNGKADLEAKQMWVNLGKQLKQELLQKEVKLVGMKDTLVEMGKRVPNLSHAIVPKGEEPNVIKVVGTKPTGDANELLPDIIADLFGADQVERSFLRHEEVGERLNLLDFESAAVSSGSRFVYLKNEAVMLELALANYALNKAVSKGFSPYTVPELARRPIIEACGFQARGEASQIYDIDNTDLSLIGTSEISLAGLHANKIIKEKDLPVKAAATSHCFRTEAGGGGGKEGGLYRLHQFTKVEMFVFCRPDQSEKIFQELVDTQEEIFRELGFHFMMLEMPSHDLGAPAARKVDIEAYMPGRGDYGELSSASDCTDYQSRRLFARYKDTNARQNMFVHTLNGTAIAVPRVILTILEHFQYKRKDNGLIGVVIPPVLRHFMGGLTHIEQKPADSSSGSGGQFDKAEHAFDDL